MLKCSFPVSATGSWKDWTPKAEIQPGPELTLVIDEIDIDGGTARIGDDPHHSAPDAEQRPFHGADDGGEFDDDYGALSEGPQGNA